MTELIIPKDGPRVQPKSPEQVNSYVRAEYDKAKETWGIPNNLSRTMGCHPLLSLTEVDYANSFIFQKNIFVEIPRPGNEKSGETSLFPAAGFVDRVTKELMISLVSLINRSRFSITHHSVIAYGTLSSEVSGNTLEEKQNRAEQMLLKLVDESGNPTFEDQFYREEKLYTELQTAILRVAVKANQNAHSVSDEEVWNLKELLSQDAINQIKNGPLDKQFATASPDKAYLDAFVDGMMVELTWCLVHFSGLLNRWFTILKVRDEEFVVNDQGQNFIEVYNSVVPESIKIRNNSILGENGWGS